MEHEYRARIRQFPDAHDLLCGFQQQAAAAAAVSVRDCLQFSVWSHQLLSERSNIELSEPATRISTLSGAWPSDTRQLHLVAFTRLWFNKLFVATHVRQL